MLLERLLKTNWLLFSLRRRTKKELVSISFEKISSALKESISFDRRLNDSKGFLSSIKYKNKKDSSNSFELREEELFSRDDTLIDNRSTPGIILAQVKDFLLIKSQFEK